MQIDTALFTLMVSYASAASIVNDSGHGWKSLAETDAELVNATVGYAAADGATWSKSGGMALIAYSVHRGGDEVKSIVKGCHSWAQGGGPDASSQCLGEGFQMLAELAAVYFVAKGGEYASVYVAQSKVVQNLLQTLTPGSKRSCLGQYSDLGQKEVSFDSGAIKMTCQATPCDPLHDEERQDVRNLMYQAGKRMGEEGINQVELTVARVKGPEAVLHCKAVLGDGTPDACPNDLTLHGCNR